MRLARYYHRLYVLPDEATTADQDEYARHGKRIEEAIERLSAEAYAE